MTFREYVEACNKLLQENPECGNYTVCTYVETTYGTIAERMDGFISVGKLYKNEDYESERFYTDSGILMDYDKKENAVCIS